MELSKNNPIERNSIPTNSIRDTNNNKISDYLDSWIELGYSELDVIVMYSEELTEVHLQKLYNLDVEIKNIFWHLKRKN